MLHHSGPTLALPVEHEIPQSLSAFGMTGEADVYDRSFGIFLRAGMSFGRLSVAGGGPTPAHACPGTGSILLAPGRRELPSNLWRCLF